MMVRRCHHVCILYKSANALLKQQACSVLTVTISRVVMVMHGAALLHNLHFERSHLYIASMLNLSLDSCIGLKLHHVRNPHA